MVPTGFLGFILCLIGLAGALALQYRAGSFSTFAP